MYKQVAPLEEQETHLHIDYSDRNLIIYSNRATVLNRIIKLGYKPARVDKIDGEIVGMSFEFETKDIGKFLRTGIFKFD